MDALRSNHAEDFILERTDMPDENIRNVQGEMVFQEERPLVCMYIVNVCMTYFFCANTLVQKKRANFGGL